MKDKNSDNKLGCKKQRNVALMENTSHECYKIGTQVLSSVMRFKCKNMMPYKLVNTSWILSWRAQSFSET